MQSHSTGIREEVNPLAAAEFYAARGWPVIPIHAPHLGKCSCVKSDCLSPGKHPRTDHGFRDGTISFEKIRAWWTQFPRSNVGIVTGAASQVVVLDVDPQHHGEDSLVKLCRDLSLNLQAVPKVQTGGGGLHFYFRAPENGVNTSAGVLGKGLDVRADRGYIVAPPSLHLSGKPYTWEIPPDGILPEIPVALLDRLREKPRSAHGRAESEDSPVTEGRRNEFLFRRGCALRAQGWSAAAIFQALLTENAARCSPPLSETAASRLLFRCKGLQWKLRYKGTAYCFGITGGHHCCAWWGKGD